MYNEYYERKLREILSEKWRFKKLKERVKQFQNKRKEILEIKKEISELEENEEVKRYLKLQDILENDILVSRNNRDADYVIYQNLESKYNGTIEVPYKEADEFEINHKIIFPQNVVSREAYFYKLQAEYFETMILESPEIASKKINKLIKK